MLPTDLLPDATVLAGRQVQLPASRLLLSEVLRQETVSQLQQP